MTTIAPAQRSAIDEAGRMPGRLILARPTSAVAPAEATTEPSRGVTTASSPAATQPATATPAAAAGTRADVPSPVIRRGAGLGTPLELVPPASRRLSGTGLDEAAPTHLTPVPAQAASSPPKPASSASDRAGDAEQAGHQGVVSHAASVAPGRDPHPRALTAASSGGIATPIVARRRARSVQRSTLHDEAPVVASPPVAAPATDFPAPADAGPIRVDRSSAGAAAASELRANAFTSGDTIVLPQDHGPLDRGRGRSLLAHELVHVNQQRRLGGQLPGEGTAAGRQLEQQAISAERAVEHVPEPALPSRPLGLPLPSLQRGRTTDAPSVPTSSDRDVRQAIDTALVLARPGSVAESARGPATSSNGQAALTPTEDSVTPSQRQDASATPAAPMAAAGGPASDAELDELARKLYDRLRHRLGRELLLDRERSGLLVDPR